jgi:hypothetical protein
MSEAKQTKRNAFTVVRNERVWQKVPFAGSISPVALGAGLSLFAELPEPLNLTLVSSSIFASGVAAHVYRPE